MRKTNEPTLTDVVQSVCGDDELARARFAARFRKVSYTCTRCGEEIACTEVALRRNRAINKVPDNGGHLVCRACSDKGRDELKEAQIALARRKGLIK